MLNLSLVSVRVTLEVLIPATDLLKAERGFDE